MSMQIGTPLREAEIWPTGLIRYYTADVLFKVNFHLITSSSLSQSLFFLSEGMQRNISVFSSLQSRLSIMLFCCCFLQGDIRVRMNNFVNMIIFRSFQKKVMQ